MGFGDYVPRTICPYPPVVAEWAQIPGSQIAADMQAMGMERLHCTEGLGGLTMDGTGLLGTGLFAGGLDLSTWGAGEWIIAAVGGYAAIGALRSITSDAKVVGSRAKKRAKKIAKSSGSAIGTLVTAGVIGGAAWYLWSQSQGAAQ